MTPNVQALMYRKKCGLNITDDDLFDIISELNEELAIAYERIETLEDEIDCLK